MFYYYITSTSFYLNWPTYTNFVISCLIVGLVYLMSYVLLRVSKISHYLILDCDDSRRFQCRTRASGCIPIAWKCDGRNDCGDNSDEEGCGKISSTQSVVENRRESTSLSMNGLHILAPFNLANLK